MKKLLLLSMLFFGTLSFAQDAFVKKYTQYITTRNYVVEDAVEMNLTVVFNENNEKVIKLYYPNGVVKTFYQVSPTEEGKTTGGYSYQLIQVVDEKDGSTLGLQLFDDSGTLRLMIANGYKIEFYK